MSTPARRVALVTGSSRGLGRVVAGRLARDGFAVAVNGLDRAETDAVARSIVQSGGDAVAFVADVTDAQSVGTLVAAVRDALGAIDALVVNATGPQPDVALVDVTWDDYAAQLDYFVKSAVLLGSSVLPGMVERRWGRIVHVDSEVVDRVPPARSPYVTAKSAQVGLARTWARELAPFAVTVNMVAPGFIPVERHADVPDETVAAYLASVPAGRMGTPDDVAHAVGFFLSEEASFVTGQRLVVDGGRGLDG